MGGPLDPMRRLLALALALVCLPSKVFFLKGPDCLFSTQGIAPAQTFSHRPFSAAGCDWAWRVESGGGGGPMAHAGWGLSERRERREVSKTNRKAGDRIWGKLEVC